MKLTADTIPQLALEFMNRDHAEFALLRDRLLGLLTAGATVEQLRSSLDALVEHTRLHFAAEEQAMQDAGFPVYVVHKGEHDRVLAEMAARAESWKQAGDNGVLRDWIERDVGAWFLAHINSMDTVTARFIAAQRSGH